MSPQHYGSEMDDVRARLKHLEGQQDDQFKQLATLSGDVRVTRTEVAFMRTDISNATEAVTKIVETINRWKGAAFIAIISAPIVGPLIAMLVRYLIYGAPLSK